MLHRKGAHLLTLTIVRVLVVGVLGDTRGGRAGRGAILVEKLLREGGDHGEVNQTGDPQRHARVHEQVLVGLAHLTNHMWGEKVQHTRRVL